MSIRNKLTIMILSVFLLNISLMIACYELVLYPKLSKEIKYKQDILDEYLNDISRKIDNDNDNIKKVLEKLNLDENIIVVLDDSNGNTLYESDKKLIGELNVNSSKIINVNNNSYLITIIEYLEIDNVKKIPIVEDLLKIEFIIIGVLLTCLTTIIYIKIVKPIINIQKDMDDYKIGIKPTETNRSDEIGMLKNNFVKLTRNLDKEKDMKNKIIASISHDIKTPLTSIMGYSERLKNKNIPEERQKRYTEIIYSKSQNIKEIIDEFDDYLSYNLDDNIKKEGINVQKLCSIVREEYEEELSQFDIKLYTECNCNDTILDIDISKIRRVFGNVIGNSIKHMEDNTKEKEIKILFERKNDKVLISINDNGHGVDEKDLDKIFEELYTSDKGRKVAGLGLSICKRIVEGHNGKIWAENNNDGGLSIKFEIRIALS